MKQLPQTISIFGYDLNIYAIMILIVFSIILFGFVKACRDKKIDWVDMVTSTDQVTGKIQASATKVLQLLGAITSTFIVIKLTIQNAITWDIFGIYLTYVAGADGFSRFMLAKYGVVNLPPNFQPMPQTQSLRQPIDEIQTQTLRPPRDPRDPRPPRA